MKRAINAKPEPPWSHTIGRSQPVGARSPNPMVNCVTTLRCKACSITPVAPLAQSMIPAGLPDASKARVAHKTGEISTVCHDAGMVFLPTRTPYVLVVLTEYASGGGAAARSRAVANISAAVYGFLHALPDLALGHLSA